MTLGQLLKELRKEKNLSQQAVADAIGVSNQSISYWETDTNEPTLTMLKKLADYFEVTTDYLLGREDIAGTKIKKEH